MARKKKAIEPVVEAPVEPMPQAEPVLEDGGPADRLKLTREEILSLKLAEAEGRASTFQLSLRQLQRDNYLARIDPKGILAKVGEEIADVSKAVQEHKTSYLTTMEAIEKRLGVSMKEYSFDEITGILVKHSDS